MEKIMIDVWINGYTKITYSDGYVKTLMPDQWASLQSARLQCRSKHGATVESTWYAEQLEELRSGR
jgi:hypothetical protein